MSTPITIHLSDEEAAVLHRIAEAHRTAPEVLVLQNLRASMKDFTKNRLDYQPERVAGGGRKVNARRMGYDEPAIIPERETPAEWG